MNADPQLIARIQHFYDVMLRQCDELSAYAISEDVNYSVEVDIYKNLISEYKDIFNEMIYIERF